MTTEADDGEAVEKSAQRDAEELSRRKRAEQDRITFMFGIEHSSDAILTTGLDGIITYVNPAFEALYGFAKADVIGKTPRVLKSGTSDALTYQRIWNTLLAKQPIRLELVNKTKDGALLDIDLSANPIARVSSRTTVSSSRSKPTRRASGVPERGS